MIERVAVRLTSRPVLPLVLAAYWLLCALAVALQYATLPTTVEAPDGRIATGDYVAFHTAAQAVHRGQGEALYERALQERLQADLGAREVRPFLYPASLAVVLSPLGALPYRAAFLVATAGSFALGLAAALLLAPALPTLRARGPLLVLAAAAGFAPVLRVWLMGGQTTVLTIFCLAGATFGLVRDRPLVCGLFVGLLGYKPQFLLPLLVVLLAWSRWRTLAVVAAMGAAHWAVGALACGPDWPLDMLRGLAWYRPMEREVNAGSHLSLLAVCEGLLPSPFARALAALLVVALLGVLVRVALPGRDDPRARRIAWAFAIAASLLTSPHTQHYDVGLLIVPALLLLEQELADGAEPTWRLRLLLVAGFFGYPLHEAGEALGVQPLVLWPVVVCAWAWSATSETYPRRITTEDTEGHRGRHGESDRRAT